MSVVVEIIGFDPKDAIILRNEVFKILFCIIKYPEDLKCSIISGDVENSNGERAPYITVFVTSDNLAIVKSKLETLNVNMNIIKATLKNKKT